MRDLSRAIRFTLSVLFLVLRVGRRGLIPAARRTFGLGAALSPVLTPILYVPLAGFVVGYLLSGFTFAVIAAVATFAVGLLMLADTGSGLSLEHLDEELRAAVQQSRRKLAARRVRSRWAETCTALGWDVTAADPRANGVAKLIRRPALRHVEHLGDRLRLAFRPRADQAPQKWPELVEGLRRHLGMFSADFYEHPTEPGTLLATFGPEPLPTVHRPGSTSAVQSQDDLRIVLGPRAGGGDAAWVPAESPHLLLAGGTGGGKGGALRVIVRDLLAAGALVKVCDPKGTGEHRWAAESGAVVVHDLAGIVEVLRQARDEITSRCAILWASGLDKMTEVALEQRLPPVYVGLDEAADVLMLRRVPTEKERDEMRSEAGSLAAMIASQGRAADVHLAVAIQRADIALLGPAGGFLRDNLAGRIGLGRLTGEGIDMLFGSGHRDRLAALTGRPGRALAVGLAAGESLPYGLQIEHVTSEDVRAEIPVMAMNGGSWRTAIRSRWSSRPPRSWRTSSTRRWRTPCRRRRRSSSSSASTRSAALCTRFVRDRVTPKGTTATAGLGSLKSPKARRVALSGTPSSRPQASEPRGAGRSQSAPRPSGRKAAGPLGNYAINAYAPEAEGVIAEPRRLIRLRLRAHLWGLVKPGEHRVSKCGRVPLAGAPVLALADDGTAHMRGLTTCGSVSACPVCAAKIRQRRAEEIDAGLGRHLAGGGAGRCS